MEISELLHSYVRHPQLKVLAKMLSGGTLHNIHIEGLNASATPMVFAALTSSFSETFGRTLLFLMDDEEKAGYFYHDLSQLLDEKKVLFYPSSYRRSIKYAQRDTANEILRTEVLSRLQMTKESLLIVSYPDAIAEKVISRQELVGNTLHISVGETHDLTDLSEKLRLQGFQHVDYVYEPGEFAIRGSILDVFSFSSEKPFRLDFFGDEVDTIRTFEVQSQLSNEKLSGVVIVPEMLGKKDSRVSFFDFLPTDTSLITYDYSLIHDLVDHIYEDGFTKQAILNQEAILSEMDEERQLDELRREFLLINGSQFLRSTMDFHRIELGNKPTGASDVKLTFKTSSQPIFHKNFDLVQQTLLDYQSKGYTIYILADSIKQNERLKTIFEGLNGGVKFEPVLKTLHEGFVDNDLKVCFFTDHQIFDRFHKYNLRSDKARSGKVALSLKELSLFEPGDFIVHVDHGVGRFSGLVRVPTADGTMQEVIKLVYQNDDVVFVSIHSLHKVSKYKGKEGEPPRLNRLGTGAWEKLKDRTKKKIKDIARDLIKLYSRRKEEKGYAYSHDSFMQNELEASFIYEDTPDQLKVTQEVKADMEKDRPMDRLVCGDVGFGKTEIAIRAAFKAAADNKQVAVLVPTTVLAFQHFQTFRERLKNFPVRVDYLSRARTSQQTRAVLNELSEGKINIIVGTHKLISKNVTFKDLGLLIIDEEQKFGVAVKEKLRQMKINVDTLTMTATPIPRTLQFSLMGARDLSVIQTPPPNRYPIQTEIHTFGHEIIADAINFEMSRNGQVFIVSNRISSLPHIETLIHKYVPDARVCIGHGQMAPDKLEQIIFDFVNHDYDVLLSTTIVENGIDIPNANTILIDSAHNFGLSDLHQMRGRVGRGNRKAFCYMLAPPLASLSQEARRRLQAIENFCDLGSGIHIAMQDLDIRGAGNLLGAEQSGFIADLGYETYQKILSEAVSELKNDEFSDLYKEEIKSGEELSGDLFVNECTLESDLEMYFPESYIPGSGERMLLYRELDNLNDDKDLDSFRKRLVDRFGPVPEKGEELIRVVPLRRLGKLLGVERIQLKRGQMHLYFVSNPDSLFYQSNVFGHCINYMQQNSRRCELSHGKGKNKLIVRKVNNIKEAVDILENMRIA